MAMIDAAEARRARSAKDTVIVEPTSGNTGIGLAFTCAARGYKLIVTMPESMSLERRRLLKAFGAEIVLTPARRGHARRGRARPRRSLKNTPNAFMPQQFKNPANPEIHRKTTAEEIWRDTDGKVDILVSGVGTGGTITGVRRGAQEPQAGVQGDRRRAGQLSPVITPDAAASEPLKPGPHKIQGIGAGFIPDVLNIDDHRRGGPGHATTRRSRWPAGWPRKKGCSAASPAARRSPAAVAGGQAARERRQADRRRPARPRRALPLDPALPRVIDDPEPGRAEPASPSPPGRSPPTSTTRWSPTASARPRWSAAASWAASAPRSRRSTRCGTPRPARPATTPTPGPDRRRRLAPRARRGDPGDLPLAPALGRPSPARPTSSENHYGDVPRIIVSLLGDPPDVRVWRLDPDRTRSSPGDGRPPTSRRAVEPGAGPATLLLGSPERLDCGNGLRSRTSRATRGLDSPCSAP